MSQESDRAAGILLAEIDSLKSSPSEEANAVAADLKEASYIIFSRATAREEERRKKVEWQKIVPLCRAAKDKFDKLNAQAEKQNVVIAQARATADDAESRLNLKLDARPSPYPTAEEIANWENGYKKLEHSLEAARATVRAANTRRGELTRELILARNEFTALVFRERNLRPRQTEPVYAGIELSGVR